MYIYIYIRQIDRVFRYKNLQKQREQQITNDNILETNKSKKCFRSYLITPEIDD